MSQPLLRLPSFAKINWRLEILGKRPDGYHEVSTLLQTISLQDTLHFKNNPDGAITISCDAPDVPIDDGNLVVRAVQALKARFEVSAGVEIHLEKRIPTKAGLGGASSNAAVALMALSELWKLTPPEGVVFEIAAGLGADVPFFLAGGTALATGIGTQLKALPDPTPEVPQYLIVISPKATISTAEAYASLNSPALTSIDANPILSSSHSGTDLQDSQLWNPRDLRNDFESVIFDIEPEIRRAKETLLQAGALGALLAGSGSSVFGIFTSHEAQQHALKVIQSEPGWRIFPCVTVSRNAYVSAFSSRGIKFLRSFNSGS